MAAATAIGTIEADAAQAHVSADLGLMVLDTALGGNAAVATEMAAHFASGAMVHDLTAAITAGTLSVDQAVAVLAGAAAGGTAATQALVGNQIASLIASYPANSTNVMADITAAVISHVLTGDQAVTRNSASLSIVSAMALSTASS
jgi:hypothetical protein